MSAEEENEIFSGHDDLDEDIERLKFVLQDEQKQNEGESDGELQVLENADEAPYSYASRPSTSSDVTASSFPTTSMGTEADDFVIRFDPSAVNAETCLDMNRAYQEVLLDTLRQIEMALNENRVRQKELSDSLEEKSTKGVMKPAATKLKPLSEYTAPYFRDSSGNPAPSNPDVQMKIAMKEDKQLVKPKPGWSKTERKRLLNAIRLDAREQQIRPIMNKLEVATGKSSKCKTVEEIDECKERIETLKDEIKEKQKMGTDELLQSVDINKIDFMKISAVEFKGKYSTSECESMWRNVLRPGINRDKWSKGEETRLHEIAAKHGTRNWKSVAEELGTKRTPFQCLQQYQKSHHIYDRSEWTNEEDELLREVVDTCQIGTGKIPWHQVAYYMERRSAKQCRTRWHKITPYIKRGKWSTNEDCMLTTSVQMVGDNDWLRVQEFVPSRCAAQCRERWQNCLDPDLKFGGWTYEEDKQLLKLHEKYKQNWVAVANYMPGRTDHMCLARNKVLSRWKKNSDVFNSEPREVKKALISSFFVMTPTGEILPKKEVLPALHTKKKKQKKRFKHDEDYTVEEERADQWMRFARRQDLQPSDYMKQIQDAKNNDIVVPRPPPLQKYTTRSYHSTWSRRKAIQKLVQACVNTKTEQDGVADPKLTVESVSESLSNIMKIDKQDTEKWEMISSALRGHMPHELTVSTLLDITRSIKNTGKIPEHLTIESDNKLKDKFDDDYNDDDETDDDEEEEEEEDSSSESETDDSEEETVQHKPKRVLTEEEKERQRWRIAKLREHRDVRFKIRETIRFKMGLAQLSKKERGRNRVYNLYPKSKPSEGPSDPSRLANKSLAILLKTFDVDGQEVYKKANTLKRKRAAAAMLNSVNCRRSKRMRVSKTSVTHKSEEMETADLVLSLRKQLDIEESEDEMELDPDQIKTEYVEEDQSKTETGESCNNVIVIESRRAEEIGINSQYRNETSLNLSGTSQFKSGTSLDQSGTGENQSRTSQQGINIVTDNHLSVVEIKNQPSMANQNATHQETLCQGSDAMDREKQVSRAASTSTKVEAGTSWSDSYDKVLPYMPPNLSNLHAMKSLLLEHRSLINRSGGFFDKEELKSHLYKIKNKGDNPLLPVFMSVNPFTNAKAKQQKESLDIDTNSLFKKQPKRMVVAKIRQTRAYQLLKARFQSLFVWPALMSTITRPKIQPPENTEDKPGPVADKDPHTTDTSAGRGDEHGTRPSVQVEHAAVDNNAAEVVIDEEDDVETDGGTNKEVDLEAEVVRENVARAVEEVMEAEGKALTQEEAIEKLVVKIWQEYKASRESKKSYVRRSRRKASELARQATFNRERTKILKRLGLWEKMKELRRQREEQEAETVTMDTMDTSITDEQTLSNSSEQALTKRTGRPAGAKNFKTFMKKYTDNVRKSSRRSQKPASLNDSILSPEKKDTKTRANNLTRLKELVPEKMSNLASQLPEVPLMMEVETVEDEPEIKRTRVKVKRRKKTPTRFLKYKATALRRSKQVTVRKRNEVGRDAVVRQVIVESNAKLRNNSVETHAVCAENQGRITETVPIAVSKSNDKDTVSQAVSMNVEDDARVRNNSVGLYSVVTENDGKVAEAVQMAESKRNNKDSVSQAMPMAVSNCKDKGSTIEAVSMAVSNCKDKSSTIEAVSMAVSNCKDMGSAKDAGPRDVEGDTEIIDNSVGTQGVDTEKGSSVPVECDTTTTMNDDYRRLDLDASGEAEQDKISGGKPGEVSVLDASADTEQCSSSRRGKPGAALDSLLDGSGDKTESQNGLPVTELVLTNQISKAPDSSRDSIRDTSSVSVLQSLQTDNVDGTHTEKSSIQETSTQVPGAQPVSEGTSTEKSHQAGATAGNSLIQETSTQVPGAQPVSEGTSTEKSHQAGSTARNSLMPQISIQVPGIQPVRDDNVSGSQEQQIMMMAIPVKVGDQEQIACVPVLVGADGKLTLHQPTPVSKAPSSDSDPQHSKP